MPDESTTPDLVELARGFLQAVNRRDLDAMMSFYAPNAVWEMAVLGVTLEGATAIRVFWQEWFASYEELCVVEREEASDLGNGVAFGVVIQKARLVGSGGEVRQQSGVVTVWMDGLMVRVIANTDIDEAHAAAERLAEERAQADV